MSEPTESTSEHELSTGELEIEELPTAEMAPPPPPPKAKGAKSPSMAPPPPPPPSGKAPADAKTEEAPPLPPAAPAAKKPAKGKARSKVARKASALKKGAAPSPKASPIVEPAKAPSNPERVSDARSLVEACQRELSAKPESRRAARLHFELGGLYEWELDDLSRAADHYQKAAKLDSDLLPALEGARRALLAAGKHRAALPFFDAAQRLVSEASARAGLLLEKGSLLEHALSHPDEALLAYREGLELEPANRMLLRAVARCEQSAEWWDAFDKTAAELAEVVSEDPPYRAALFVERARLAETRRLKPELAEELFHGALALDGSASGAIEAVKRLGYSQAKWSPLLEGLKREAERSNDEQVRAAAWFRVARIESRELGNRQAAIEALEKATFASPDDRAIWLALAEEYEAAGTLDRLVAALEKIGTLAQTPSERLVIAHRLGRIAERDLHDPEATERWYRAALELDGSFKPALMALSNLYRVKRRYGDLLALLQIELGAVANPLERAAIHGRMADLLESHLDDPGEAAEHHAQAFELAPAHEGSVMALTRLYSTAGRWRELVGVYERAIDHAPDPSVTFAYLLRIGAVHEDHLDDAVGAVNAYQRILRVDAEHLGALHALQRSAIRSEQPQLAVEAVEREAKLTANKERIVALFYRAAELHDGALDDPASAIDRLRRVLELDPAHRGGMHYLADLYRRAGRWEDLLSTYELELAQTEAPSGRVALLHRMGALCESELGRPSEAVVHYQAALVADPEHAPSYEALRALLIRSEGFGELIELFEARLSTLQNPVGRAHLGYELGLIYEEELAQRDKALSAYERALEQQPTFRPAIDARSRILARAERWKPLVDALVAESELSKDVLLAIDALSRAGTLRAERLGDKPGAVELFERILKIAPGHLGALLALESLYRDLKNTRALARVYLEQSEVLRDPPARAAALRELALLTGELHGAESPEAEDACRKLLELAPDEGWALERLAMNAEARDDLAAVAGFRDRLVKLAPHPSAASRHRLRVAAMLEDAGRAEALDIYRGALSSDPESFAATRGYSRAALRKLEPDPMLEAAENEMRVTRDQAQALHLLVEAGRISRERGDAPTSVRAAQRALEIDPDNEDAADLLRGALLSLDEPERLLDLLAQAADAAKTPERKAALYVQVAGIRAERMGSLPGALSAVERALEASPRHPEALQRLAAYLERGGQWEKAAEAYHGVAMHSQDTDVRAAAQLRMAVIREEHLDDRPKALAALKAVLAHDANHREALGRLGRLYAQSGKPNDALAIATRLVEVADSPDQKAETLVDVARIERACGRPAEAAGALSTAIAIQGPEGAAAQTYREMLGEHATWQGYVDALRLNLEVARRDGKPGGAAARAVAAVQLDQLEQPSGAVATLEAALEDWPDDASLWLELAARLRQLERHETALSVIRRRLDLVVSDSAMWREMSAVHGAAGRTEEAVASSIPLLVLDAAENEEIVELRGRRANPASAPAGFLGEAGLHEVQVGGALDEPVRELVTAMHGTFAKLYPGDPRHYGLGKRDRIQPRSGNTLRVAADRVASIVASPEIELYQHAGEAVDVGVELGETPALFVPASVAELPRPALIFLLTRRLVTCAHQLEAVDRVPIAEMVVLLAAAVRHHVPGFGAGLAPDAELEATAKEVYKATPRRSRRAIEVAAAKVAAIQGLDLERWVRNVRQTASRAALLLADDLPTALVMVERTSGETLRAKGTATDLLRFWGSDTALRFRQQRGS